MITYSEKLYVSNSIKDKKISAIKLGIKQGRGRLKLFLLTLSNNNSDQIDIIHNSMLKQRSYRKLDLRIIGFANSYEEATSLVVDIMNDTIAATGNCNMKDYLSAFFD